MGLRTLLLQGRAKLHMLAFFTEWLQKNRAARRAREAAWRDAHVLGADGLTAFERESIRDIESIVGPLTLTRAGEKMPYLFGPIPGTKYVLHLYADEAQIHGEKPIYMKEHWHFDSPAKSIEHLVACVRALCIK